MRKAITIGTALFLVAATASSAGLMDRSDCLNGPTSFYSGVDGALSSLQKRLVACFNYGNEVEVENHNAQAREIGLLHAKIDRLEQQLAIQESKLSILETRLLAAADK
ncbi:hypothetical protein [Rhizobium sp. Root1203]|uniref:hypothetical protein n=1 Tax=Rhizobium sp. Root1203 TaxID=1736427 RepID=UPI0012E35B54|nr:hypothetical protein [Rhizobium sp. Root1203]